MTSPTTLHQPPTTALRNRVALITGASRGIGQAVAVRFAAEGAHVILVARSVKGLEETDDMVRAAGGSATLVPLDLTEFGKYDELAQLVHQRFGRIDILVGNAGVLGEITPIAHITPSEWDKVMAVNVTANYHLIRCFDPLLKLSDTPRAIFVTSGITSHVSPYWGGYAISKAALNTLVETYAAENAKTPLRVNLLSPGAVRTRMRAQAMPGEDPETLVKPEAITGLFVQLASPACQDTGKKFFAQDH